MWTYLAWIKINWWDVNEKKLELYRLYIFIYIIYLSFWIVHLWQGYVCVFSLKVLKNDGNHYLGQILTTKRESTSYIIYNFFSRKKLKIHWHIEPLTIFSVYIHSIIVFRNFLHLQFKFSHHNLRFHLDKSNQLKPRWSFKTRSVFLQSI